MRAGLLNTRVTLQKPVAGVDAYGRPVRDTWEDVATVWARVRPLTGREYFATEVVNNVATFSIHIRHRKDVENNWRIIHGSTVYEIKGTPINEGNRNKELIFTCEVVDA